MNEYVKEGINKQLRTLKFNKTDSKLYPEDVYSFLLKLQENLKDQTEKIANNITEEIFTYFIEKAGAAQVAVIGPTNVGRSSLLRAVTNSQVVPAPWPFSTNTPTPGMLTFLDIQFQLVESPPIVEGSSEGRADGFKVLSVARNADGLIIVIDLTRDPGGDLLMVLR